MNRRWRGTALAVLMVAGPIGLPPGEAHQGGKLQIFLSRLRIEPAADGRKVSVVLIDADSATKATGYDVTLAGSHATAGTFGPVALAASSGGRYSGTMPGDPGRWTLTLRAKDRPGTNPAVPLVERLSFELVAGEPVEVVNRGPGGKQSLARGLVALGVIAVGALLVALVIVPALRRRRT